MYVLFGQPLQIGNILAWRWFTIFSFAIFSILLPNYWNTVAIFTIIFILDRWDSTSAVVKPVKYEWFISSNIYFYKSKFSLTEQLRNATSSTPLLVRSAVCINNACAPVQVVHCEYYIQCVGGLPIHYPICFTDQRFLSNDTIQTYENVQLVNLWWQFCSNSWAVPMNIIFPIWNDHNGRFRIIFEAGNIRISRDFIWI